MALHELNSLLLYICIISTDNSWFW